MIRGGQSVVLVTSNMKDLPQKAFAGTMVQVTRPGTLLNDLLAADPNVARVLIKMIGRFKAPPISQEDLLDVLSASNCNQFATSLAAAWGFTRG